MYKTREACLYVSCSNLRHLTPESFEQCAGPHCRLQCWQSSRDASRHRHQTVAVHAAS